MRAFYFTLMFYPDDIDTIDDILKSDIKLIEITMKVVSSSLSSTPMTKAGPLALIFW